MHHHDFYLVAFAVAGTGQHEDDQGPIPLLPGDVCIVPPEQRHGYPRVDEALSVFNLAIARDYLAACAPLLGDRSVLGPLPPDQIDPHTGRDSVRSVMRVRLSPQDLDSVRLLLFTLSVELQDSPEPGQESMHAGLALQILGLLDRYHRSHHRPESDASLPTPPHEGLGDPGLLAAVGYLEEHYAQALTVEHLAQHCGYTPTYLARKFRQHLGMSPSAYLLQLRLQHACSLLRNTNLSVASIALAVGFRDSHYFATRFHEAMGTTPSGFRAQSRIAL